MAATTGAVFVQYAPNYWYFYISHTKNTDMAYRIVDANNKDTRYTIEEAKSIEPRAFVHPYNGLMYCFYVTDGSVLKCVRFVPANGSYNRIGYVMRRKYATGNNNITVPSNFGVTPVPDGFLVTHWDNTSKLELSHFVIADEPDTSGNWLPRTTQPLPWVKDSSTYKNLPNHSSTVVVDGATNGLRLVLSILDSSTNVLIRESPLDSNLAVETSASDWESYAYVPSKGIKSARLFMHTGCDGRAYVSYYTIDRPCHVVRTTKMDAQKMPVSPLQRTWVEDFQNDLTTANYSGMLTSSAPTAAYFASSSSTGTTSTAGNLTAARVPVTRKTVIAYQNGDYFYPRPAYFGDARRDPLPEIPMEKSSGLLLGWAEGAPPMPYQNLSLSGTSIQTAAVGITDQTTKAAATTVSGSNAFAIESDGYLATGMKMNGKGWDLGVAWSFAMEVGASWTQMKLTGVTSTTEIAQAVTDFRVLTDSDVGEIPGGNPSLVGTLWPPDTGTVFVQRTAVTGFAYRFVPAGCTVDTIPPDVPLMYEFGPSKIVVQSLGYFIDPSEVVPGDLVSYKNPSRINRLNTYPRAAFNTGTFGTGNPPYVSWSAGGGSVATDMSWFTQEDKAKTGFLDITLLAGLYWSAEGLVNSSSGKILVGTHHTYAETTSNSTSRSLALGTKIQLRGDLRDPNSYSSFTSDTYFIDPVDETPQSKQLCEELRASLLWAGMPDDKRATNQKVLDAIDWDNSESNPWKICFTVPFSQPTALPLGKTT